MIGKNLSGNPFQYIPVWKSLEKKISNKPFPVQMLHRRTMNTAIAVLVALENVPFQKLESSLYFFCESLESQRFVHEYEAQLELAEANADKFMWGLYPFYNQMATRIKKEDLYDDFLILQHLCEKQLFTREIDDQQRLVIEAYISLLMENMEYLRPNKFDFNQVLCGRKTTGEILTTTDMFPLLDLPGYMESLPTINEVFDRQDYFKATISSYQKQGYPVKDLNEIENLMNMDRTWSNNVLDLSLYINEYTLDILPQRPFISNVNGVMKLQSNLTPWVLRELLTKRKRTLPSNGYIINFGEGLFYKQALMKEIYQNNRIVMLYKIMSVHGDLCGSYDTKDGYFYSVLNDYRGDGYEAIHDNFESLILYLYATAVLNNSEIVTQKLGDYFSWDHKSMTMDAYGIGGKPKNYTETEKDSPLEKAARKGNDAYQTEQKAIQGYIRHLPVGQHASEKAVALALSLGYDLETDETYVQPFIKRVFRLRETESKGNG